MPDWLENTLAIVTIALAAATPTVAALRALAGKLRVVAATTTWDGDDKAIATAEIWLTQIAQVLEFVGAYMPHIAVRGKAKSGPSA